MKIDSTRFGFFVEYTIDSNSARTYYTTNYDANDLCYYVGLIDHQLQHIVLCPKQFIWYDNYDFGCKNMHTSTFSFVVMVR